MLAAVVKLISGVFRGSVIGPLMFLIHINCLVVLLCQYNVKLKPFADVCMLNLLIVLILLYYGRHFLLVIWLLRFT